jgi:hypothetical protein
VPMHLWQMAMEVRYVPWCFLFYGVLIEMGLKKSC